GTKLVPVHFADLLGRHHLCAEGVAVSSNPTRFFFRLGNERAGVLLGGWLFCLKDDSQTILCSGAAPRDHRQKLSPGLHGAAPLIGVIWQTFLSCPVTNALPSGVNV